jgi:S-DNA-T family DNA segregation ATPase FtsK/SpoIIIE
MSRKRSQPKKKKNTFHLNLSPEAKKSIWGTFLLFIAIFLVLSVMGYGGQAGGAVIRVLTLFFGIGGLWIIIALFTSAAFVFYFSERPYPYTSTMMGGVIFILSSFGLLELIRRDLGGFLGRIVVAAPREYFGTGGSWALFIALFLISISLLFNTSVFRKLFILARKQIKKRLEGKEEIEEVVLKEGEAEVKVKEIMPQKEEKNEKEGETSVIKKLGDKIVKHGAQEVLSKYKYKSLPLSLLDKEENHAVAGGDLRANAQIIKRTFQTFGIEVEMGEINIGPTVTQYTLKPAEGIKIAKLLSLQRDLSLSLAAHPIRMEAPIPGRSLVGIEVPNEKRAQVRLANLFGGKEFYSMPPLVIPIGKDVMGNPFYADLERMPHTLVAGATGAGKTVFLNSLILSLLWRNSPEVLRLVLIDPKRVEFTPYKALPHLLCPPITQNAKVVPVVKWLIEEMETRFGILHDAGQRDIISYNEVVMKKEQRNGEDNPNVPKKLPYIVVIIDELADIMASRGKEFEAGVVRLAQMSRAVGIHLVLATQRPSVEVLTGLIKANITARIAFQVASQVDSRTVLDTAGAEKLLGRGDMLFLSADVGKPRRIQSAFVSSKEIKKVVDYIEETEEKVSQELEDSLEETLQSAPEQESFGVGGGDDDELYEEAKMVVVRARKASASLLQRRLKVGYARAARLLDILEDKGIVGPSQGAKPRDVFVSEEVGDEEII